MGIKKMTVIFIAIAFAAIAIYDVYAIVNGGTEASISHTMIVWTYKYPIFTFLMGVVCGHLFWRVRGGTEMRKIEDDTRKSEE